MTEEYTHITYEIGFVAGDMSEEEKARILAKMNSRLQAQVDDMFYGSKESRRQEAEARVMELASKVARGPIWGLTADTP